MTTRRDFLVGSGAVLAALGLPVRLAHADALPTDRKFLFVFNTGGWDPTRVFATEFANPNVDMEPGSGLVTSGDLSWVAHPLRPSVDTFLDLHRDRTVILNGVLVRSIAHEICTMIAMTGTSSGTSPDWPAILADRQRGRFTLPHLVLAGPSFPGDLGVAVARTGTNGQLEALLSGQSIDQTDTPVRRLTAPAEHLVDRYLTRRAAAAADGARSAVAARLKADYLEAHDKAVALKDLQYIMDFTGGALLEDQARVAVEALSLGLCRCVTLNYPGDGQFGWDSHANNDAEQSVLFEGLFAGLGQLMELLQTTPGEVEPTLADETVVVVLSEMGRTPMLNDFNGKDHWPYTSVMLVGPGLTGSRVIGGFDDQYFGHPVDSLSGEVTNSGQLLSAEVVGATLLAMADIDPAEFTQGVDPLMGILT